MQTLIDIDDDLYTRLFDNGIEDHEMSNDDVSAMATAIRKGKTLPKGHGAIIDIKQIHRVEIEDSCTGRKMIWNNNPKINDTTYYLTAPTIIEADTGDK